MARSGRLNAPTTSNLTFSVSLFTVKVNPHSSMRVRLLPEHFLPGLVSLDGLFVLSLGLLVTLRVLLHLLPVSTPGQALALPRTLVLYGQERSRRVPTPPRGDGEPAWVWSDAGTCKTAQDRLSTGYHNAVQSGRSAAV